MSLRAHLATAVTVRARPGAAQTRTMSPASSPAVAPAAVPRAPGRAAAARWWLVALHAAAAAAGLATGYLAL